jgi:hypothetical protein
VPWAALIPGVPRGFNAVVALSGLMSCWVQKRQTK